jgi:LysM repeat protein
MILNRLTKLVAIISSALLVATGFIALSAQPKAEAANAAQFDPGNIISDSVFYDFGTMTVAEIQRFLNSKVPACNDADGGPKCIKDFVMDTPAIQGEDGRCESLPAAQNQTAAQIIYTVSRACKINPRVLIVTLQKEQGLIQAGNPTQRMYDFALGMSCPDTAAGCSKSAAGFFYQLYKGAGQLQWYGDPRGSFTYLRVGTMISRKYQAANVEYSQGVSCGSRTFELKSNATAALYYYTPYTPNEAAMKNLYGSGDRCSAYGNRNFWRFYTDWFGSTLGGGFLLKSATSGNYFIIEDKKYLIEDVETVVAFKPLGPLGTVSQDYLDSFTDAGPMSRVVKSPAGNFFFIDGGQRYQFTNCAQATQFGVNCDTAPAVTASQISALPSGGVMTEYVSGENGQTFFIQDGTKRQILDAESLAESRIGVPALSGVKISAFKKLPWGKPIIRKGASFTNLATNKLSIFDGTVYYDIDDATAADIDFTKWFIKSTGSMLGEAIASSAATVKIQSIVNDPAGTQYLITKDGKRKVVDAKIIAKNAPTVSLDFLSFIPDAPVDLEPAIIAKSASAKSVYLVSEGEKRLLLSAADASRFAPVVKTTKVETISNSAVAQIPSGHPIIAPGAYVRSNDSTKTYMIDGLKRALIVNDTNQAALLGLKNLRTIPAAQFKGYAKTSKISGIKFVCDAQYYIAITGKLYPVSELDASHYPGRGITLDKLTCAAMIKSTSTIGRFVSTSTKQYYLVEGQKKKLIKSAAAYEKLRGTEPKAVTVGPFFLSKLPTGTVAGTSVSVERFPVEPPIVLPEPNIAPVPTPSTTPKPSASPKPAVSPKPIASPKPSASPTSSASPKPSGSPTVKPKTYTVVSGDYLNKIAAKFGVSASALMTANKITNANSIKIGQVLVIP